MIKGPIEKILVHIDGSEESLAAVEYGILLAKAVNARIFGAYIVNTRALSDLRKSHIFLAAEEAEYARDIEQDARRYLEHAARTAAAKGVELETIQSSGNVHQELLRIINEKKIDLLVIGELPHVRSRLDEFYNESERVMRSASCSVLIVKDADRVDDLFGSEE